MKRIFSFIMSVCTLSTSLIPMTVNAGTLFPETDLGWMECEVDGVKCKWLYNPMPFMNVGYLYLMEDVECVPAVENVCKLSDICSGIEESTECKISIAHNAMDMYGDVYFSTELAEDKIGISQIIDLNMCNYQHAYLDGDIFIALNYTSIEAYKAESEEVLNEIFALLPEDEYGYKISSTTTEPIIGNDGYVRIYITYAGIDNLEANSEIARIFKHAALGDYKNSEPELWAKFFDIPKLLYNSDKVLGAKVRTIYGGGLIMPAITSYVRDIDQIEYNVVYSADGSAGDANNDGLLELADVQTLLSHKANSAAGITEPIVSATPDNMDVDGDGEVTIKDAQYLLTYCAQQAAGMNPTWESVINA